jgi:hypothetical protein
MTRDKLASITSYMTYLTAALVSVLPLAANAQDQGDGPTMQLLRASDRKEMSAVEPLRFAKVAQRKCGKDRKSKYAFAGHSMPNRYKMNFKSDKVTTDCTERFPLLATYNVMTRGAVTMRFRGELVPSGTEGIYEGLMIQQMGKSKRAPEFIIEIRKFPVKDVK